MPRCRRGMSSWSPSPPLAPSTSRLACSRPPQRLSRWISTPVPTELTRCSSDRPGTRRNISSAKSRTSTRSTAAADRSRPSIPIPTHMSPSLPRTSSSSTTAPSRTRRPSLAQCLLRNSISLRTAMAATRDPGRSTPLRSGMAALQCAISSPRAANRTMQSASMISSEIHSTPIPDQAPSSRTNLSTTLPAAWMPAVHHPFPVRLAEVRIRKAGRTPRTALRESATALPAITRSTTSGAPTRLARTMPCELRTTRPIPRPRRAKSCCCRKRTHISSTSRAAPARLTDPWPRSPSTTPRSAKTRSCIFSATRTGPIPTAPSSAAPLTSRKARP